MGKNDKFTPGILGVQSSVVKGLSAFQTEHFHLQQIIDFSI